MSDRNQRLIFFIAVLIFVAIGVVVQTSVNESNRFSEEQQRRLKIDEWERKHKEVERQRLATLHSLTTTTAVVSAPTTTTTATTTPASPPTQPPSTTTTTGPERFPTTVPTIPGTTVPSTTSTTDPERLVCSLLPICSRSAQPRWSKYRW